MIYQLTMCECLNVFKGTPITQSLRIRCIFILIHLPSIRRFYTHREQPYGNRCPRSLCQIPPTYTIIPGKNVNLQSDDKPCAKLASLSASFMRTFTTPIVVGLTWPPTKVVAHGISPWANKFLQNWRDLNERNHFLLKRMKPKVSFDFFLPLFGSLFSG